MSKKQIGGYGYNEEKARIRNAANSIAESLQSLLAGNLGSQTVLAHAANMIMQVGIILNAVSKLDEFGEQARNERTDR